MTPDDFRKEALRLKEADEKSHMGHPDFRVKGKIFATLGYPDQAWGMVRLTLEHQRMFVQSHPEVFSLVQAAPGLRGRTLVRLKTADVGIVQEALRTAWLARAPKPAGTETSSRKKRDGKIR